MHLVVMTSHTCVIMRSQCALIKDNDPHCHSRKVKIISSEGIVLLRRLLNRNNMMCSFSSSVFELFTYGLNTVTELTYIF